ncbi:MAG: nickel pincer cofactor biosynthesis protein LarB [Elusimicrobia bacterium]|nr:nickel pincer cofactor biosynthesis protein LarB [Elusimicrobiota bacterium]
MDEKKLKEIIGKIKNGGMSRQKALELLRQLPYQDMGYAKIDHHRAVRKGYPEVIYAEGKTPMQIIRIAGEIYNKSNTVLITRVDNEKYAQIKGKLPAHYYSDKGRVIRIGRQASCKTRPAVPVLTAGTSDIGVAEEAAVTLEAMGNRTERIYDVGVAGIHRVLSQTKKLEKSRVIVVVAGMDGVLPSIVGGLVRQPVIAVPTSCGYGTSLSGLAPLLTMLNSCAPGVLVVNIDNGFGAGYAASLINCI